MNFKNEKQIYYHSYFTVRFIERFRTIKLLRGTIVLEQMLANN